MNRTTGTGTEVPNTPSHGQLSRNGANQCRSTDAQVEIHRRQIPPCTKHGTEQQRTHSTHPQSTTSCRRPYEEPSGTDIYQI